MTVSRSRCRTRRVPRPAALCRVAAMHATRLYGGAQNGSVQIKVKLTTPFQKARVAQRARCARSGSAPSLRDARTGPPSAPQIFDAFCKQRNVEPGTMRFHLDGKRLRGTHTPAEVRFGLGHQPNAQCRAYNHSTSQLDMQDDDSIDAFVEQLGGCALRVAAAA